MRHKTPAWTRSEGKNPEGGLNAKGRASAKGDMKKPNGEPTRKALALKAWGFGSVAAARAFANRHKKK